MAHFRKVATAATIHRLLLLDAAEVQEEPGGQRADAQLVLPVVASSDSR